MYSFKPSSILAAQESNGPIEAIALHHPRITFQTRGYVSATPSDYLLVGFDQFTLSPVGDWALKAMDTGIQVALKLPESHPRLDYPRMAAMFLRSPHKHERILGVQMIERMRDKRLAPWIAEILKNPDEDYQVLDAAINALEMVGDYKFAMDALRIPSSKWGTGYLRDQAQRALRLIRFKSSRPLDRAREMAHAFTVSQDPRLWPAYEYACLVPRADRF